MTKLNLAKPVFATVIAMLCCEPKAASPASDYLKYCNAVQNKVGFIRYPLGTVGAWSTASGELADVITRAPKIYPCVGTPVLKPAREDWRESVAGDPSLLTIRYQSNRPSGPSMTEITVSPHVTVFRVNFPAGQLKRHLIFDFARPEVDSWAALLRWTNRAVRLVDPRTLQAIVTESGKTGAHYLVRFSAPCVSWGTLDASGTLFEGVTNAAGTSPVMFAQFDVPTITVAVAVSFSSLDKARQFMEAEFDSFDLVRKRCQLAWNKVLGRLEVDGEEPAKRMAYTALYTIYANIIDGSDGGRYAGFYPRPRSVASSAYWQFIGGYHSCCWDNCRATYPFLALAFPEVMTDLVNTYLARYNRDGYMGGDSCLFTGTRGPNIRLVPVMIAQALGSGVRADYPAIYAALKRNFADEKFTAGLRTKGYLLEPVAGGFACSRSLEFHTGFHALALLAKSQNDDASAVNYLRLSGCYSNLWDAENKVFRVKDADGNWGPIENSKMTWNPNPQGLFEGTSKDWSFAVPHDPCGLMNLAGQDDFVTRLIDYCQNDVWFNDYQYVYPYMLYYAGAANEAQRLIRNVWVPLFNQGVMYEGIKPKPPHNPWQTHYVGVSGWLLCSVLGLYPAPTPPGQFIIATPSVERAVVRTGRRTITIQTRNNSKDNIYVSSIKLDGKLYPAYMVPASRLAAGARIEVELCNDAGAGLGEVYVSSTDGFLVEAKLSAPSLLKCTVKAPVAGATTKIFSRTRPTAIFVNGEQTSDWTYDERRRLVTVRTADTATIEVKLK